MGGRQARDCAAVVASLHGAALLLALLRCAHRHGGMVCLHELYSALDHVRLLCGDSDKVPQEGCAVCDLHHLAAAPADARWHVCHLEGRDVPGGWRGVPREQDKLDLGIDDVCQLLCPLLQAVCGQLLLEAQESQEAALREGCHEVSEPKDHSSHRRRQQRG